MPGPSGAKGCKQEKGTSQGKAETDRIKAWLEAFSHLLSSTSGVLQGLSAQLGTTFVIYSVKKHQLVPWHLAAWLVKPTRIFMFVHVRVHVASCFNGKQCSLPERGPTLQHPVELVHRSITLLCLSQEVFFFFVQFFFLCYQPILLPGKLSILRYSKLQVRLDKYFWPSSGGNDYAVYDVDHLSFVKTCKCLIEQPRAWRHARCFFLINIFSGIYATWHSYFF